MTEMGVILETHGLTKHYRHQWTFRRFCVLDSLDLQVNEAEIFGLIGPNGAGKTTTFKLLLGLLRPTSGTATFYGQPLQPAARAAIGFLPEHPYFYDYLTVNETLDLYARLYGLPSKIRHGRVNEIIDQVQLGHKRDARLRTLSKGTLQRVGIAQAILNHPRLVILDEPMSGLDPAGRHHMRELILSLRQKGTTVIFSSHVLPDTEALCDRVGILTQGRLREVVDLRKNDKAEAYLLKVKQVDGATLANLADLASSAPTPQADGWHIRLASSVAVGCALDVVRQANGLIESLNPIYPSVEERFLTYVGHASTLD